MATSQIVTKLTLDGKKFSKDVSDTTKSVTALAASGAAVTAALGAAAVSTAAFQDQMIKSARDAGTTAEKFSGLALGAEQSGIKFEQFRDLLSKINTNKAQKALTAMGIATKDTNGNLKDTVDVFRDFADEVKNAGSPADKTAKAIEVFGNRGFKLVNFLQAGKEGLDAFKTKAEELGIVVGTDAALAAEVFNDNLNDIGQATKGVINGIGETIIALVNQSGILDTIQEALQSVTKFWRGLDKDTRETIVTIVGITAALATLIGVMGGLVALMPIIKGFFATLAANPVVLAIAAIIVLVVALANSIRKNWDQMSNIIDPISESFENLWNTLKSAVSGITEAFASLSGGADDMAELGSGADKAGDEIDIFGTIAKGVFSALAVGLRVSVAGFKILIDIAKLNIEILTNLGKLIKGIFTFDIDEIKDAIGGMGDAFEEGFANIKAEAMQTWDDIGKIVSDPVVKNNVRKQQEEVRKEFKKTQKAVNEAGGGKAPKSLALINDELATATFRTREWLNEIGATDSALGNAFVKSVNEAVKSIRKYEGALMTAGDIAGDFAEVAAAEIMAANTLVQRDLQVQLNAFKEAAENELAILEEMMADQLAGTEAMFDAEIEALRNAEADKLRIIQQGVVDRQLALDAEFLSAKQRAEMEFQRFIEAETRKFDAHKEILDGQAVDNEQRKLQETILEEDFRKFLENEENKHQDTLTKIEQEFMGKRSAEDEKAKQKALDLKDQTDKKIAKKEAKKDKQLEKLERQFNRKIEKMAEQQAKAEAKIEREMVRKQYDAEMAAFRQTKDFRKAETIVTGAQAAISAYNSLAPIPFVGPALGAAAASAVAVLTGKKLALIDSQKPPKPAALFAQGGVLTGPRHTQGGIPIEAEGGEAILDRVRTQNFMDAADKLAGSGGASITFESGSVIIQGVEGASPEMMDMISQALFERIQERSAGL